MTNQKKTDSAPLMSLNHYLAQAGVCSRRNAAELIKLGHVKINGKVNRDPSYRVQPDDKVVCKGKSVALKKKIYIILNKPTDCITTTSDDRGRRTIFDMISTQLVHEGLFPVGRLDKDTTGLILITNDGVLAQRLAHPRHSVMKVYHVSLERPVEPEHIEAIAKGVTLSDGFVKVDRVSFIPSRTTYNVRIHLHSGRNRVVRRIFEAFQYEVVKLDRISYAGIEKKGLTVGKWRYLSDTEVAKLYSL